LDHLAVQAPCINIYARLLPGITNVTDRARYYSFYPWLIWAFDQRGYTTFDTEFIERFRRADCLFTLIAERHAVAVGDSYDDHAAAMVGSDTLGPIARALQPAQVIKISDYSALDGATARYFKNKLGGLGQYYLGVLRELQLLDGDASRGIKYTRQLGGRLAQELQQGFDGKLFLDCVDNDRVSVEQLDTLSPLRSCKLKDNQGEQQTLVDLFFARGHFSGIEALPRRRSLQSILQLSELLSDKGHGMTETEFRACSYTSSLPDGEAWPVRDSLRGNRAKWGIYARNELLSIAVQGLFAALLRAYEEEGLRLHSSSQIAGWYMTQPEVQGAFDGLGTKQDFSKCVADSHGWLPPLSDWLNNAHEIQLADRIARLTVAKPGAEQRREVIAAALRILIALASRSIAGKDPYGEIVFNERYFQSYPINLRAFNRLSKSDWTSMALSDLLTWLFVNWGLELHLRVALRKLRGQSKSTFRIRPTENGMEVTTVPLAVPTRPRFRQAVRILKDIGAMTRSESGLWHSNRLGKSMIELGDAP
jgi:hypothetical protein